MNSNSYALLRDMSAAEAELNTTLQEFAHAVNKGIAGGHGRLGGPPCGHYLLDPLVEKFKQQTQTERE